MNETFSSETKNPNQKIKPGFAHFYFLYFLEDDIMHMSASILCQYMNIGVCE